MSHSSLRKKLIPLLLLCTVFLSACGAKNETPEAAATNALNAVKAVDMATIHKYFGSDTDLFNAGQQTEVNTSAEDKAFIETIVKNLTFEVVSSSIDGDKATVSVAITNTDMSAIFAQYLQVIFQEAFQYAFLPEEQRPSEEEMAQLYMQRFQELMAKEDNPTVTTNLDMSLTKNENTWLITADPALLDAIFGGLISSMEGFTDSLNSPLT